MGWGKRLNTISIFVTVKRENNTNVTGAPIILAVQRKNEAALCVPELFIFSLRT
jgi:hypothetical protein